MKRPEEYALIEKVLFATKGSAPPVTGIPRWMRATLLGAGLVMTVTQCGGPRSGAATTADPSPGDSPTSESPRPDATDKSPAPMSEKEQTPPLASTTATEAAMTPPNTHITNTPVAPQPKKTVKTTTVSFTGVTLVRCKTPGKTTALGSVLYQPPEKPGAPLLSLSRPAPMYGGPRLQPRDRKLARAEFSYDLPVDAPNDLQSVIRKRKYRMLSCLKRHFQETRCNPRRLYGSMAITIAKGRVEFKMLGLASPLLKKCIASCRTSIKNTRYSALLKAKIKAHLH